MNQTISTIPAAERSMRTIVGQDINQVTTAPGVYLFKNADQEVLYVGKARNLKKRLASYFGRKSHDSIKTHVLLAHVIALETIVTATEKEALILESTLIKRHKPRYNVILKDDKRYPSLCLDVTHPYPNLFIVRKTARNGMHYFGPFSSAQAVRETLKVINKTFKLRKCKNRDFASRSRPCLHFQMDACLAPCCLEVAPDTYREMVREVMLFLKGRTPRLIQQTRAAMLSAAQVQEYERAATLRDKLFALEKTLEKQVVVTADFQSRDVFAAARSGDVAVVTLVMIRGGYLQGTRHFRIGKTLAEMGELIERALQYFYEQAPFVPPEILISDAIANRQLLADWLTTMQGRKVRIHRPLRGEKRRILELAEQNAVNELERFCRTISEQTDRLRRLRKRLHLPSLPRRIECFDNSNMSGDQPVAGMVVFEHAQPQGEAYRRYRLNSAGGFDDYAAMAEVLTRRYGKSDPSLPFPDLLMVDGGKGQLNIALSILRHLGLSGQIPAVALAKKSEARHETRDKVYLPKRSNPVDLSRDPDLLLLLQQIRDEAHRYAIAYQRNRRRRSGIRSLLDTVVGVGEKRKKTLLTHYKSLKKIRAASPDELSALPGMNRKVAEAVLEALRSR